MQLTASMDGGRDVGDVKVVADGSAQEIQDRMTDVRMTEDRMTDEKQMLQKFAEKMFHAFEERHYHIAQKFEERFAKIESAILEIKNDLIVVVKRNQRQRSE